MLTEGEEEGKVKTSLRKISRFTQGLDNFFVLSAQTFIAHVPLRYEARSYENKKCIKKASRIEVKTSMERVSCTASSTTTETTFDNFVINKT